MVAMTDADREQLDHAREWIEDWLLGDVRTLLEGIRVVSHLETRETPDGPYGYGNLSVPILLGTATEVLAALHAGSTQTCRNYNATDNVIGFIGEYWPRPYRKLPHVLWDGMRNGLVHTFAAKWFDADGVKVDLQFSLSDETVIQWRGEQHATLVVSIYALYRAVRGAAKRYFHEVSCNEEPMRKFRTAFEQIRSYRRTIPPPSPMWKELQWLVAHSREGEEYDLIAGKWRPARMAHIIRGDSPVVASTSNPDVLSLDSQPEGPGDLDEGGH